jgi:hypothetical protein
MILTSIDRGYKDGSFIFVIEGGTRTNEPDPLTIYTINGPSYSNDAIVFTPPKTDHKKNLRNFTNQLNERDRKRRWRK